MLDEYKKCIEACYLCATACDNCAASCLDEENLWIGPYISIHFLSLNP